MTAPLITWPTEDLAPGTIGSCLACVGVDDREEAAARADRWNATHPPGTPVVLTDTFGRDHHTRTRSIAWPVEYRVAVLVDGFDGVCLLDSIRPDTTKEPRP